MRLAETRAALRRNLAGARAVWDDEVLDGGVARAADDLDRLIPNEVIADFTLDFAVSAEVWASGTLGSEVTLANKRIKPKSETVKDSGGTVTYVRDTDYTMDYVSGTITTIAAGDIVDSSNNQIDYTILEVYADISSLTDLIRIFRVEYPGGQVPASFQTYYTWGNLLALSSSGRESQQRLASGEHLWVYYHAKHTTPDKDTDATWLPQLDEVILKGAQAYCLITKAMELRHSVRTRHTSVATALGELAAIATLIDTALTDTRDQASSSVADMSSIDAHISNMVATLASAGTFLSSASDAVVDAQAQGELVAADIVDADAPIADALTKLASVDVLISKTNLMLDDARTYAATSVSPGNVAKAYLDTIVPLINDSDKKLADIDAYRAQAEAFIDFAGGTLGALALGGSDYYLRTRAHSVMGKIDNLVDNPIFKVGANIDAAGNRLIEGLAVLNQVNIGDSVSEMYRRYADTWLVAARMRYDEWLTFLGQVDRYVAISNSLIAQAGERRAHADTYLSDANIVLGQVNALLSQISAYQANVDKQIDLAQLDLNRSRTITETASVKVGNTGRVLEQAGGYGNVARLHLDAADTGVRLMEAKIASAVQYVSMAQVKIAEGTAIQAIIDAILNRVGQKIEVSRVYQGEADRRLQQVGYKLQEADRHANLATQESDLADEFEASGIRLKEEFMSILTDRAQVHTDSALTPTRQEAPA